MHLRALTSMYGYNCVDVRDAGRHNYWIKSNLGSSVPLSPTSGAFSYLDWASNPATDVDVTLFVILIIPAATPVLNSECTRFSNKITQL